jgi:hypothetical protein
MPQGSRFRGRLTSWRNRRSWKISTRQGRPQRAKLPAFVALPFGPFCWAKK